MVIRVKFLFISCVVVISKDPRRGVSGVLVASKRIARPGRPGMGDDSKLCMCNDALRSTRGTGNI